MSRTTRPDCLPWMEDDFDPTSRSDCSAAIEEAHAFLHGELPEEAGEVIRQHLMACEECQDFYEAEEMITELLRRTNVVAPASRVLRVRIEALHVNLLAA